MYKVDVTTERNEVTEKAYRVDSTIPNLIQIFQVISEMNHADRETHKG
jgi:hypothetical protein